jgi:hypothetical protein
MAYKKITLARFNVERAQSALRNRKKKGDFAKTLEDRKRRLKEWKSWI